LTPPRCPRCTTSGGVQAAASLAAATVVSPAAASALVSIHASRLASDTLPLFRDIDYFHCLSSQTWQDYWLDAISVCLARGRGRIGSEVARTNIFHREQFTPYLAQAAVSALAQIQVPLQNDVTIAYDRVAPEPEPAPERADSRTAPDRRIIKPNPLIPLTLPPGRYPHQAAVQPSAEDMPLLCHAT
jgi:hypothetical protein